MKTPKEQIQQLADRMDLAAEDINAHDFVFTHRALALLAVKTIGVEPTLALLTALRREKGLPGLTGVCGREPKRGTFLARSKMDTHWGIWKIP